MRSVVWAVLACLCASALASPVTDKIRKNTEATFGLKVESVRKAGHLGLYEVVTPGKILYTDAQATSFVVGNIFDSKSKSNVTNKRLSETLPWSLAVKQVRGSGARVLVTFEDPHCGYCKRLAKDLLKVPDVTVYTFVVPILGPDSVARTKALWCAPDRTKAWLDWMTADVPPPAPKPGCDAPISRLLALGDGFQINSTPTLLFSDGTKLPGALPGEDLEKALSAAQ